MVCITIGTPNAWVLGIHTIRGLYAQAAAVIGYIIKSGEMS